MLEVLSNERLTLSGKADPLASIWTRPRTGAGRDLQWNS